MATLRSRARRRQQNVTPSPLENLMAMNEQAGKARRKSARPRDPTKAVEKFYSRQLTALVDIIAREAEQELIPALKDERDRYVNDSTAGRVLAAARQTERRPSERQRESGNYRKGKVQLHGLTVTIENPRGSVREGTDPDGRAWRTKMPHHYGYISRTEGADGDHVDVFIGPEPDSELVCVVDQVDPGTRAFDEHKVLMGFRSAESARQGYLDAYEAGWNGLGGLKVLDLSEFKAWLQQGRLDRPIRGQRTGIVDGMITDADTMDSWADRILRVVNTLTERFRSGAFLSQLRRLSNRTVSMAESESTDAFLQSVNEAVGVDMSEVMTSEGLQDYLQVATEQNTEMIRDLTDEHLDSIRNSVLSGVRNGDAPSTIARQIRERTGVSKRRAKTIARDQTGKLTSEITERRQTQAGVKYYKAIDSGDIRVTGRPGGKYPNAKISCWGIARQDIGFGPGVYRWDQGAEWGGFKGLHPGRHHINCRCTAKPVFEWELPEKARAQ